MGCSFILSRSGVFAMTRINKKFTRLYMDGYDISGYSNEIGSLDWLYDVTPNAAFSDSVMNGINGKAVVSAGTINAFLDNDTAGLTSLTQTGAGTKNIMVAFGTNAVPVAGDPVFAWKFEQSNYQKTEGDSFSAVTLNVSNASYTSPPTYQKPWGVLLAPMAARTAASTATGIDDIGAASALGGIFVYHASSSDGTFTLTAEEASSNLNASFAAITGATSGSIDASVTPKSGMIELGTTAAIKRYLRFQLALGSATTVTFCSAFIRIV